MAEKNYVNAETLEITNSHKEAMAWYRAGANIDIYVNGIRKCGWVH